MTYRPNDGFYGQDEIFYYVEDEYGLTSSRAKIIINVTNNRPNGVDYILSTNMNQSIKVELKGEDRDKIDVVKLAYILEKVHLTELLKEIEILGTSILTLLIMILQDLIRLLIEFMMEHNIVMCMLLP